VEKLEGKIPLGSPRRRCVDNSRMVLWGELLYRAMVGISEGKKPLGRNRLKFVDNIKMDLCEEWGA
jgi:hypothetical protein